MSQITNVNVLINFGFHDSDLDLLNRMNMDDAYFIIQDGHIYLTDGNTYILVREYETIGIEGMN